MKSANILALLLLVAILTNSCKKEPHQPLPPSPAELSNGLMVLNEGLFNMNNSTLTWYDFATGKSQTDYFEIRNSRRLGDTGNDIGIYGSKIYIVVSLSGTVEVLDRHTGKSIRQISLSPTNGSRLPRSVAFGAGMAFVCAFDGTVTAIDTTSLQPVRTITVGRNPEDIAVMNNKIYVSNSGGLDFPNYDSTISVIDIASFQEVKRITVRINPSFLHHGPCGKLFVISRGNYADIKSCLQVIDTQTDQLVHTFEGFEPVNMAIHGDTAYVYTNNHTGTAQSVLMLCLSTWQVIQPYFIADATTIETIYGIAIDPVSGNIFIADARGFVNQGRVLFFDTNGALLKTIPTGLNPGRMMIIP
ncbi:MAG TPA: DUF5074 domain-containing protein [Bacteroidales bacterium]|nr:DUF5074 domain-containing protein [Bacteroidales bacterium]